MKTAVADPKPGRDVAERRLGNSLAFRRLHELVDHLAGLHRRMGDILARRSRETGDEKLRALLERLGESERSLAGALISTHRRAGGPNGREDERWLQNTPSSVVRRAEERIARLDDLHLAELDHEARAASRELTRFFSELCAAAPTSLQRERLARLCELERQVDRRHSTTVDRSLV